MTSRILLPVLLVLTLSSASAFGAICSNATLLGNYGFLVTGSANGSPIALQGQIVADGNGGITGTQTTSVNGATSATAAITGTYAINAKCAGTAKITPQGGTTAGYSLVALSGGRVELVGTDSGAVVSGFALAQGLTACSQNINAGSGLQQTGALTAQGPVAFGGQISLHPDGTLTGTRSGNVNGSVVLGDSISGAYKFGSSCFGGAVLSINHGPPSHSNLVLTSGRD